MKKRYAGLKAEVVSFKRDDVILTSGKCVAMIQLTLENGVCTSPEWQQQIEYVGDQS